MPKIIKNSITYGSSSPMVELTQAEYNALSSAQKNNGTIYLITDSEPDAFNLNSMDDVNISSPTNKQVLAYNSSTTKWENSGEFVTSSTLLNNLARFNLGFGTSLSTTVGRNHWLCLLSSEVYVVWFYSTSSVAARNVGTNTQVIGQDNSATVGNYTFTRGTGNILTVTTDGTNATMTIIG